MFDSVVNTRSTYEIAVQSKQERFHRKQKNTLVTRSEKHPKQFGAQASIAANPSHVMQEIRVPCHGALLSLALSSLASLAL